MHGATIKIIQCIVYSIFSDKNKQLAWGGFEKYRKSDQKDVIQCKYWYR
jgi:hypothetical protein